MCIKSNNAGERRLPRYHAVTCCKRYGSIIITDGNIVTGFTALKRINISINNIHFAVFTIEAV